MAVGNGGHLVPLLDGHGSSGLDAALLRRLYIGHFLARWGARCAANAKLPRLIIIELGESAALWY